MNLRIAEIETPLGPFTLALEGETLHAAAFSDHFAPRLEPLTRRFGSLPRPEAAPAALAARFAAYWAGDLGALDAIAVDLGGTPFQARVWSALRRIPAGRTVSYGELAEEVSRLAAPRERATARPSGPLSLARAVGAANAANPVAIVIPCHRVIRADGSLCGYAGGVPRKLGLLAHEGVSLLPSCRSPRPPQRLAGLAPAGR
jgi:methylated-DNA-[protein]-cysteine S-methyltransferase